MEYFALLIYSLRLMLRDKATMQLVIIVLTFSTRSSYDSYDSYDSRSSLCPGLKNGLL